MVRAISCCGGFHEPLSSRRGCGDANGLAARESVRFTFQAVGGQPVQWFGRCVFYKSDGTERYVVLQLDPTAGALQDFGLVTF